MSRFARDLVRIVAINLVVKPAWILAENGVQNVVGHESYGVYAALFSLTFVLATMLDPGLTQFATREIAARNLNRQQIFATVFWLKAGLSLAFPGVVFVVVSALGFTHTYMVWALIGAQICVAMTAFFRGVLQGTQRFYADGFFSVADKALLFPLLFVFWAGMTVEKFAVLNFFSTFVVALIAAGAVRRFARYPLPRLAQFRYVVKYAGNFAVMVLLYNLLDRLNPILVERWAGAQAAGLFAGAHRWFNAFSMYLWMVLPIFYAKFAQSRDTNLIAAGLPYVAIPLIGVGGFCVFHGEKLLFLFTRSSPHEIGLMSDVLSVMGLTLILAAIHNIFSTYLTATGNEKTVNVLIVLALLADVGVCALFVDEYGPLAGAYGLLAAHTVLFFGYPAALNVRGRIPLPYPVLFSLVVFAIVYLLTLKLTADWRWMISTITAASASGAIVAVLLRLARKRNLPK
jgi:O-antigen/teichoic acid export membrane protein